MLIKSNRVRILHMLRSIDAIATFGAINLWDVKDFSATIWQLQTIGEAASKVDATLREKYPMIPWKNMIGFRHYAVHEYEGIEHDAIHAALKSLPELRQQLQQIITDHADDF